MCSQCSCFFFAIKNSNYTTNNWLIDGNNSHLMTRNKNLFLSKLNTCVQNAERSADAPCFSLQPKIQIKLRKICCIIRIFLLIKLPKVQVWAHFTQLLGAFKISLKFASLIKRIIRSFVWKFSMCNFFLQQWTQSKNKNMEIHILE